MSEWFGVIEMRGNQLVHGLKTRKLDQAISLLGQCAGNYGHFLMETLPKLPLVDSVDAYDGLPILVDGWMNDNHYQLLSLFNKKSRPIIGIDMHRPVHLKRARCASVYWLCPTGVSLCHRT